MTPRMFLAAAACLGLAGCSGTIFGGDLTETREAEAVVDALGVQLGKAGHSIQARTQRLYAEGAEVQARFEPALLRRAAHPASLILPRAADGSLALADDHGQVAVRVRLRDARPVQAEAGRGLVVYRQALADGG